MDGVGATSPIDAVNQVLMVATQQSMQAMDKLMKVTVQTAVGAETVKGENFDSVA
jgi:hypothetical protein